MTFAAYCSAGPDGSDETRRLYLDLLESALTGVLTRDGNAAPWGDGRIRSGKKALWSRLAEVRRDHDWHRQDAQPSPPGRDGSRGGRRGRPAGGGRVARRRLYLHARNPGRAWSKNRTVWVADSFAGLPKPDETLYPADKGDPHHTFDELSVSLDVVKDNFTRFGLLDEQVAFLPGWFKDTLPQAPIEQLSVLRLDGDMYGSTMDTLQALYPRVARRLRHRRRLHPAGLPPGRRRLPGTARDQ